MTEDEVLSYWFADDPATHRAVWFEQDSDFDAACTRFAGALRDAKSGALDHWTATPRGTLALIILLDQFSRNLHRGSPESFAADAKARQIATAAVAKGFDRPFCAVERLFMYLPFAHSESLADQDESVRLFAALDAEQSDWACRHREVIVRFGRFPRRNAALGRTSTPDEAVYLAELGVGS